MAWFPPAALVARVVGATVGRRRFHRGAAAGAVAALAAYGGAAIAFEPQVAPAARLVVGCASAAATVVFALLAVCEWRAGLVAAALALAIGASGAFLAVVEAVEAAVTRSVARDLGHVVVTEYGLDFDEDRGIAGTIAQVPGVRAIAPYVHVPLVAVPVDHAGAPAGPPVTCVGRGVAPPHVGEVPDPVEVAPFDAGHLPRVVLGAGLARRLRVVPGDRLTLAAPADVDGTGRTGPPRAAAVEVAGIVTRGLATLDDRGLWLHLSTAQALAFGRRRVSGLAVFADDPGRARALARAIARRLPPRFRVISFDEAFAGFFAEVRRFRAVGAVLGLLLTLAGAGLFGAVLRLLVHRVGRTLGVLARLGLSPRHGRIVFAATVAAVAVAGGVAGTGLALGLSHAASMALRSVEGRLTGYEGIALADVAAGVVGPIAAASVVAVSTAVVVPLSRRSPRARSHADRAAPPYTC